MFHCDCLVLSPVQSGREDAGGENAGGSVFEQIGHPLGSGKANSNSMPPDWGPLIGRLERIVDPEASGLGSGRSGNRQEFGEAGSRRWCGGHDKAFVRGKLHAQSLDLAVSGFGSGDQEILTSFDAYVCCLYTEIVDVEADAKPWRYSSDLVNGRFEHCPELEGGRGAASSDATSWANGAG
jgi:hypothetical protein